MSLLDIPIHPRVSGNQVQPPSPYMQRSRPILERSHTLGIRYAFFSAVLLLIELELSPAGSAPLASERLA